jgi:hypothetical protein
MEVRMPKNLCFQTTQRVSVQSPASIPQPLALISRQHSYLSLQSCIHLQILFLFGITNLMKARRHTHLIVLQS